MRKRARNVSRKKGTVVGVQDDVNSSDGNVKLCVVALAQRNPADAKASTTPATGVASDDPVTAAAKCAMDSFYEKLIKLHESSGLSFIFNLRETKVDLYVFYKAVTERDGFNQVSKCGKWEEVASLLNPKNHLSLLPSQFQKVYENILYRYEQMYFYRVPVKVSKKEGRSVDDVDDEDNGDGSVYSILKKKGCANASEDHAEERNTDSGQGSTCLPYLAPKAFITEPVSGFDSAVRKSIVQKSPDENVSIDESHSPPKPRSAYHIFLRMECDRLKKIHGESPGTLNFRGMALEEWKNLSPSDRQPYVEASQKERERFKREAADKEQPRKKRKYQKRSKESKSATMEDDYHVTLQADDGNSFVPDESVLESTMQVLKNARPSDPFFQTNWDGFSEFPD